MNTFHLVACVSTKLGRAAPARELYCSQWFKLVRGIVEQCGEPWAILSARYNLLLPDAIAQPYNETLATKSRDERMRWAGTILDILPGVISNFAPGTDRYVIWGGESYYEFLAPALNAELPLRGLGIGQQLAKLKAMSKPGEAK